MKAPAVRMRYQTIEFDNVDIHLRTLKDNLQFDENDIAAKDLGISSAQWSLFGVVWASGQILANTMFKYDIEGKRILEIGCGIGLASLILNHRLADITASDYHPTAEDFLAENVKLNDGKKIPFHRSDWNEPDTDLGEFDLIIGSDLLYESEHAEILSIFIERHAKTECEVIMIDPGRGNHAGFSKKMVKLGFSHHQRKPSTEELQDVKFKGQILSYDR